MCFGDGFDCEMLFFSLFFIIFSEYVRISPLFHFGNMNITEIG